MNETVTQPKNAWLVGIVVAAIAIGYFVLLNTSSFPEPGANLEYDLKAFEDLDNIDPAYAEQGVLPIQVDGARALATAPGKIYVGGTNLIVVYGEDGAELARHTVDGVPNCLAIDTDGTIYAGLQKTVAVLNPDGTLKATWNAFTDRSFLTSIALKEGEVYVADAGKRVVYRLNSDGVVQTRIGEKDEARDVPGLEVPSPYLDLAANPDGDLWVVNPGKLGLEQYRADGSIVTSWYRPTVLALEGFPGCCNPTHIAFDSKGNLLTTEKGMVRVKQFEVTAGTYEGLVAASEQFPQEQSVKDLAVDAKDRVLVLDAKRGAIRVFARKEVTNGSPS
jgi:hypothetical protein